MAFASISAMRWGENSDYIGVYGTGSANAGVTYVHANPKYINVNRWEFKDKSGKLLIQDIVRTALAGGGFVEYLAPRSAGGAELRKVSYVGALAPATSFWRFRRAPMSTISTPWCFAG